MARVFFKDKSNGFRVSLDGSKVINTIHREFIVFNLYRFIIRQNRFQILHVLFHSATEEHDRPIQIQKMLK